MQTSDRDKLILDGVKEIKYVLGRVRSRIPSCIEYSDLVSESIVAIIEAVEKWDSNHESNAKFTTFVRYRIRGAMIDFVRHNLPLHAKAAEMTDLGWQHSKFGDHGQFAEDEFIRGKLGILDLSALSREDCIWIELYFNRGVSQGEISRRLKIAHSGATATIWRVVQKIRDSNNINVSGRWPRNGNNGDGG